MDRRVASGCRSSRNRRRSKRYFGSDRLNAHTSYIAPVWKGSGERRFKTRSVVPRAPYARTASVKAPRRVNSSSVCRRDTGTLPPPCSGCARRYPVRSTQRSFESSGSWTMPKTGTVDRRHKSAWSSTGTAYPLAARYDKPDFSWSATHKGVKPA
jgi:hypothetical protein